MPLASQANGRCAATRYSVPFWRGPFSAARASNRLSSPHLQLVDEVLDIIGTPDEHKEEQAQGNGQGHHPKSDQHASHTQPGPHNGPTKTQRTIEYNQWKTQRIRAKGYALLVRNSASTGWDPHLSRWGNVRLFSDPRTWCS